MERLGQTAPLLVPDVCRQPARYTYSGGFDAASAWLDGYYRGVEAYRRESGPYEVVLEAWTSFTDWLADALGLPCGARSWMQCAVTVRKAASDDAEAFRRLSEFYSAWSRGEPAYVPAPFVPSPREGRSGGEG